MSLLIKSHDLDVKPLKSKHFDIDFSQFYKNSMGALYLMLMISDRPHSSYAFLTVTMAGYEDPEAGPQYELPVIVHTDRSYEDQVRMLQKILARRELQIVNYRIVASTDDQEILAAKLRLVEVCHRCTLVRCPFLLYSFQFFSPDKSYLEEIKAITVYLRKLMVAHIGVDPKLLKTDFSISDVDNTLPAHATTPVSGITRAWNALTSVFRPRQSPDSTSH